MYPPSYSYLKEKDNAIGCLVGLIAGDDNGGPTAMMMSILDYIAFNKAWNVNGVGKRYLEWFNEDGYDAGLVTHKVLELVDSGVSFGEATKQVDTELDGMTAGISPAHRSIPLSIFFLLWYLRSPNFFEAFPNTGFQDFETEIQSEAELTHFHEDAGKISVAVNAICLYLMLGNDYLVSIRFGMKFLNTVWSGDIINYIDSLTINDLRGGGYAPDAFIAALWFLLNTHSFKDALKQSKEFAGVSNYCPVLVGSMGGAMYGYHSIKPCLKGVNKENLEVVKSTVDSLITPKNIEDFSTKKNFCKDVKKVCQL